MAKFVEFSGFEVERLQSDLADVTHALKNEIAMNERLRTALQGISNVLGTGACTQANCEGCHYEMVQSAGLAREALASDKAS